MEKDASKPQVEVSDQAAVSNDSPDPPRAILLVLNDTTMSMVLAACLQDAGYRVTRAAAFVEATELLARQAFDLLIMDLLDAIPDTEPDGGNPLTRALLDAARPMPVGLVVDRPLPRRWTLRHVFAFIQRDLGDLNDLLTRVAAVLAPPPDWTSLRRDVLVRRYFAALVRRDWDDLRAVCTPDVRYALGTTAVPVEGIEAFLAYSRERMRRYVLPRHPLVRTYVMPDGIAARFVLETIRPDLGNTLGTGGIVFGFAEGRIARIHVSVPSRLLPPAPDAVAASHRAADKGDGKASCLL